MKPIDQMNLAECLNELHVISRYNRPIIDRIHDLTRWIPVSERMPTHNDADIRGKVMWYFWGEHYESRFWSFRDKGATHWQRITPPEGV